jgi:hypothetical protein
MADYYPLIAGVVAALDRNTAEVRRAIYENMRAGFLDQMRKRDPPLSEADIAQQRLSLEEAIRKVEAEQLGRMAGR